MELLSWTEGPPQSFAHGLPNGLSERAARLDPAPLWARIESWTGYRWAVRSFEAVVEGEGEWLAPVRPVTVATVDRWGDAWEADVLVAGYLGGVALRDGRWRITGTAGSGEVGDEVALAAYGRLAEYVAAVGTNAGLRSESHDVGSVSISWRRDPEALAQAIQLSGAADLLRPYRRAR